MPSFDDLNDLILALSTNVHSLNSTEKQNLVDLLRVALEVKGEQSLEGALAALREEIKNTLKTYDAIKTAAINELEDEITQKVNNLEQLKKEKTNLQTQLKEAEQKNEELEALDAVELQRQLEEKNAKITELETTNQKTEQKNKELEAQKQPTEQPKPGKAPMYTATVGVGLATGLAAFIALERTVRLDIWVTVGIAVVAALAISGGTYLALKPSLK